MAFDLGGMAGGVLGGVAQGYGTKKAAESQSAASRYGTDVSAQTAAKQLEAEKALNQYNLTSQQNLANAYRSAYQGAQNQYNTGETNLSNLYSKSPEELETLKQQILTGQSKELQQGTGQLNAALASSGVRGGQAATQLRRGIGEMTQNASENLQNITANDALERAKEQRGYTAQQQQALQNFMLNPQSAQYSQTQSGDQATQLKNLLAQYMKSGY